MADDTQPSSDAIAAARYLRMVGATRRRPRPAPRPTVIEVDEIEPIRPSEAHPDDVAESPEIDWSEAIRLGPQGQGPDVTIDDTSPDSFAKAMRDSYGAELERESRDRAMRTGAEIDPFSGAEHSGFVPLRDERDTAQLRMDATDTQDAINAETDAREREEARRSVLRHTMSYDDPRIAESFMNDAERQRYRDAAHVRPSMLTSGIRGFAQGVSGGSTDEVLGTLQGALPGHDASDDREAWEQAYADAELENPFSYDLGQALSVLPAILSRGGIQGGLSRWAGDSPTAIGRALRTGAVGAGLGGFTGVMSSRDPLFTDETIGRGLGGATIGGALGLGGAAVGEGLDAAIRSAPRGATALDDAAAPIRVRSAGGRTIGNLRELDELPGGMEGVAQRLDETGIMPRGRMLDTPEDAGVRAVETMQRGGRRIGETFDAANAARAAETGYRGVSNAGTVDLEPIAQRLDEIADRYARIPGAQDQANIAASLAAEYRNRGVVTLDEAQEIKRFLDTEINWRPTAGISSRLSPIQQSLRDVRGTLVSQMDSTVGRLGDDALSNYQLGRSEYQMGHIFGDLARDNRLREAANRQISLSDYLSMGIGASAGASTGNPLISAASGAAGLALNHYGRAREAAIKATALERMADALRWVGRRTPRFATMARVLSEAASRSPEALEGALRILQRNDPEQFQALDAAVQQAPVAPEVEDEYHDLRQPSLGGAPPEEDEYRELRGAP